jgi:hypothetical protein
LPAYPRIFERKFFRQIFKCGVAAVFPWQHHRIAIFGGLATSTGSNFRTDGIRWQAHQKNGKNNMSHSLREEDRIFFSKSNLPKGYNSKAFQVAIQHPVFAKVTPVFPLTRTRKE